MPRRDSLILIEAHDETGRDGFNTPVLDWVTHCQAWAAVEVLSEEQKLAAGEVGTATVARFTVLDNSKTRAVTTRHRISYGGRDWNIRGAVPLAKGRAYLVVVTAVAAPVAGVP